MSKEAYDKIRAGLEEVLVMSRQSPYFLVSGNGVDAACEKAKRAMAFYAKVAGDGTETI